VGLVCSVVPGASGREHKLQVSENKVLTIILFRSTKDEVRHLYHIRKSLFIYRSFTIVRAVKFRR
jgi:hypothetical protein